MHHCVQLIASCSLLTYSPLIILFICCSSAYMLLHSIQQSSLFVMMTKDMPFFIEMPSDSSPISYFRRSFLALSTIVQTDSQVVWYNIHFCSFSDLHEKIFPFKNRKSFQEEPDFFPFKIARCEYILSNRERFALQFLVSSLAKLVKTSVWNCCLEFFSLFSDIESFPILQLVEQLKTSCSKILYW